MRIAEASVVARSVGVGGDHPRAHAVLGEALRVGDGVAAAAVREREHVGGLAELLVDLERRRLLALDPVRVEPS